MKHLPVLIALLLAGCAGAPDKLPPPKSSSSLILSPKDRQVLRTVPLNGELRVYLPSPEAGPSLTWELVSNNTKVLAQTSALKPAPHPTPAQSFVVTFQAIHPGRSTIRFAALKPGSPVSEPDDLYQIAVGVKSE